ncbi:WXG100 family type VII secretion target [Amycolatopsis sp. NPDC051071]|uniref:WXG100 family type VII secretion target n=1 Tax=Amycolatopsis sp. NPDC051071 TaxID=3154637 RepID=UPI00342637C3
MTTPYDGFAVSGNVPHLAERMVALSKQIDTALVDLEQSIKPMTDSWVGQGATAYTDLQRRWHATTQAMEGRFAKGHQTLSLSFENYQRTDTNIGAKFQI